MGERRKVMIVADVRGGYSYHTGDEAILTATVAWWRRSMPDVELVVLSDDPVATAEVHGVVAMQTPRVPEWFAAGGGVCLLPAISRGVLRWLCERMAGRFPDAIAVMQSLRGAWVLHVAGGGNLTSEYHQLLVLRSFMAQAARAFGVPVLVTGQQVGPQLTSGDRRLIRGWLRKAVVVGLRDARSLEECCRLGVVEERLLLTGDDALALAAGPLPSEIGGLPRPLIGLSLHHHGERSGRQATIARLADVLGPWLRQTGASVLMIPHIRSQVSSRCDKVLADEFLARVGDGLPVCRVLSGNCRDVEVKAAMAACDFVVTTRFHGAVFALSSGVPVFMIGQEEYSCAKFSGLAGYVGLTGDVPMLADEALPGRLVAAWRGREEERRRLSGTMAVVRARFEGVRDEVRRRLEEGMASWHRDHGRHMA